jgi:prepilin-type N-terminal cleavage/methylation domain-containing protein
VKRTRGFTFIELIAGILIIAITSIASLEFFKYCYKNFILLDKLSLEAVNYARSSMETIYMKAYTSSELADTSGLWVEETPAPGGGLAKAGARKYHSVSVKTTPAGAEYKVISTKVTWTR